MDEFIAKVSKITLNPGDTLAITIKSDSVDSETITQFRQSFKSKFPDNHVVIVGVGSQDDVNYSVIEKVG